ncbi:MAG: TonB-dependent receptor plug domain-containing protein, partial [Sphingobacterium sp.]
MIKKTQLFVLTIWFLVTSTLLYGQEMREYSGVILNADTKEPLIGVSVKAKNSAVQTDEQGKFLIQANQGEELVTSLLGYESVSIQLAGESALEIQMHEVSADLEGVVVIGYGTAKKSDLTGSVVRINMADKALQANTNLLQSLIGATSGVNLESKGGASSEPSLSIRGQTSLSASDRPLIVLDGVIYNGSINNINMNDVEAVDILKDASAAAVYGSRAANGVMLITTKKGKTEKPVVAFNTYAGFQDMTNNPMRVMDGDEFAVRLLDWDWQNKVYDWYKTKPTDASSRPVRPDVSDRNVVAGYLRTIEEKENYLAGRSIDWVDEVLQTAPMQYYNLSLQGKSAMSNYYLSGSYSDVEGVQLNDRMKRITLRSNIDSRVNDWLK